MFNLKIIFIVVLCLIGINGCSLVFTPDYGLGSPTFWDGYYCPRWISDNKILAVHDISTTSRGETVDESVIEEIAVDTKSTRELFKIQGDNLDLEIMPSPKGSYLAILKSNKIGLYDMSGKKIAMIVPDEGEIKSFDWSPDETKIVYAVPYKTEGYGYDKEYIYIYDIFLVDNIFGDQSKTFLVSGESVTWSYGDFIYYTFHQELYRVRMDGMSPEAFGLQTYYPQIPKNDSPYIYAKSAYSGYYGRVDLNKKSFESLTDKWKYVYGKPFLSPDCQKLVMDSNQGGIWLFYLATELEEQIK